MLIICKSRYYIGIIVAIHQHHRLLYELELLVRNP